MCHEEGIEYIMCHFCSPTPFSLRMRIGQLLISICLRMRAYVYCAVLAVCDSAAVVFACGLIEASVFII